MVKSLCAICTQKKLAAAFWTVELRVLAVCSDWQHIAGPNDTEHKWSASMNWIVYCACIREERIRIISTVRWWKVQGNGHTLKLSNSCSIYWTIDGRCVYGIAWLNGCWEAARTLHTWARVACRIQLVDWIGIKWINNCNEQFPLKAFVLCNVLWCTQQNICTLSHIHSKLLQHDIIGDWLVSDSAFWEYSSWLFRASLFLMAFFRI